MNKSALFFFFCSILGLFVFSGCDDDDDDDDGNFSDIPLTYNPDEHIYGTLGFDRETTWEVVINPVTGQLDSIPGTELSLPLSLPLGPRFFQQFDPDQRFLNTINGDFVLQDLESFNYETFVSDSGSGLINPQFIAEGRSDDELIIMDGDQSLWRANRPERSLNRWLNDLTPQGRIAVYVYQVGENQILRLFDGGNCINCATVTTMDVVNFDENEVLAFGDLSGEAFGFVKHPDRNEFYFISRVNNGFRLGSLSWDGSLLNERIISSEDLDIDDLAGQRQTIHTASNSFITVSPRGDIEVPENVLYRIDLTTGELLGEVMLETGGTLFKIAGE